MRRHFQSLNLKQGLTRGLLLSGITLLSGCGDLNSQFSCPNQPGVTCESLDQVNTKVDQGQWAEKQPLLSKKSKKDEKGEKTQKSKRLGDSLTLPVSDFPEPIIRSPESVMRVWIAPYQDVQGNSFSSTVVYHVIEPGHWLTEPAIKDDQHV